MSAALPSLDIQEQIARIDHAIAETHKFQAETNKLTAEGRKIRRDYWLAPLAIVSAVIVGILARLPDFLKIFGIG